MKQALLMLVVFGLCSAVVFGGEEPLAWTYSESWWNNVTPDQETNCISQDEGALEGPFVTCANARFELTIRQTAELNPAANVHGLEMTATIRDVSTNLIVAQELLSDYYADSEHYLFGTSCA